MQSNPIDIRALFNDYLKAFPSLGLYYYEPTGKLQSDVIWTSKNVGHFRREGVKRGFSCFVKRQPQEYASLDLCWYEGYPSHPNKIDYWNLRPKHMELALEHQCTPGAQRVYYAFSKLCDVKAYTKVLLCFAEWGRMTHKPDQLAAALAKAVQLSSIKVETEQYLLIIFWEDKEEKDKSQALRVNGYGIDRLGTLVPIGDAGFSIDRQH